MRIAMLCMRRLLMGLGLLALFFYAACWTDYPWKWYRWLSMPEAVLAEEPALIVVLGGGGIPSETGLMRTYYGAVAAARHPQADVVVALPGNPDAPRSSVRMMAEELVLRGVDRDRIQFEPLGTNTRSQAVELRRQYEDSVASLPVLIVTSPEHLRRSVLTFRRAGFHNAGALSARSEGLKGGTLNVTREGVDDRFVSERFEGSIQIRYQFWHGLSYLTRAAREYTALLYYGLKGWI